MENKHLYHAGRIFSEATYNQRALENEVLNQLLAGTNVTKFSPLFDNKANKKNDINNLPKARDIFEGDTEQVIKSDIIYAELDGEDPGVVAELGIAWGINYILEKIAVKLLSEYSNLENVNEYKTLEKFVGEVVDEVPYKTVYATISDIRRQLAGEYDGEHVPVGFNQFVIGMVEDMGTIDYSFANSLSRMANDLNLKHKPKSINMAIQVPLCEE